VSKSIFSWFYFPLFKFDSHCFSCTPFKLTSFGIIIYFLTDNVNLSLFVFNYFWRIPSLNMIFETAENIKLFVILVNWALKAKTNSPIKDSSFSGVVSNKSNNLIYNFSFSFKLCLLFSNLSYIANKGWYFSWKIVQGKFWPFCRIN